MSAVARRLVASLLVPALTAGLYVVAVDSVAVDSAQAGSFHKCKTVKKVRRYKVNKVKATRPVPCSDARKVTKKWAQREFDQNNAIQRSGRNWFCTWRKRDPGSVDTGTADCEAGASDEIRYLVRKR